MAVNEVAIIGSDVEVTVNGVDISRWDTLSLKIPDKDFQVDSASSLYEQFVDSKFPQAVLSFKGKQGAGSGPANRDVVTGLKIGIGSDSLVAETLTDPARGIWKVKDTNYDWAEGPADMSFDIKSNYAR